ncbi:MAG: hypothetical protein OEW17_06275 [Gemmatimonadota bacterium]|nr:hypothetical protein [Gemmatimonadota bacterium]MDH4348391.1 hypothetical protein [Gemmatimonadota bacterium]MDH5284063.1 hypothetical protein [Gemmatimonadota bacterium]
MSLPPRAARPGLVLSLLLVTTALAAQDPVIPDGVRIGIEYRPGVRPAVVLLPGNGIDSIREIVARDLDFSDRFDLVHLPADAAAGASLGGVTPNHALLRTLGADFAVELRPDGSKVIVRVHEVATGAPRREQTVQLPAPFDLGFRMAVHRVSDEIVRWITGTAGYAASQLLFIVDRRLYRVDSDGAGFTTLSPAGEEVLSPTWSPDGGRIAFTRFGAGVGAVIVQGGAGARSVLAGTTTALNITPAFSPDGKLVAYAHANEEGTHIFIADAVQNCCPQRLTAGRYADNLSPTFSPDGRRVAFVSTRAGPPQIYVMGLDGTEQELLAPFDYGVTGSSNAPEWSPDGATVAFHRDVNRAPQIFVVDVASRRVRQLSSAGRNEDPTWAPDGRHLAFVSNRSGRRQLWVIDMVTGRIRQLTFVGDVRLPAWSRRMAGPASLVHSAP